MSIITVNRIVEYWDVYKYLIKKGIKKKWLFIKEMGFSKPIAPILVLFQFFLPFGKNRSL